MNLKYLVLRLLRHFMPESAARFLLKRRLLIQPGFESSDPSAAAERYVETLSGCGVSVEGKCILVFGYGGRFAVGVELLRRGAAHVTLCDHFVLLDKERNRQLLPDYSDYLALEDGEVKPRSEHITLLHGDIREADIQRKISPVDCVLSTSVYEHLDDVEGITRALANLTAPEGIHLHFVDLRDHYFKYPFEMLAYSEGVWKSFLNPTSNLNRLRLPEYRKIFESCFQHVDVRVLERLDAEFQATVGRIRPEFLSGDPFVDAVTSIQVVAWQPFPPEKVMTG